MEGLEISPDYWMLENVKAEGGTVFCVDIAAPVKKALGASRESGTRSGESPPIACALGSGQDWGSEGWGCVVTSHAVRPRARARALLSTCESPRLVGSGTQQALEPLTSAVAMRPGAGRGWGRGSGSGVGRGPGCQVGIGGAEPWPGDRGSEIRVRSCVGRGYWFRSRVGECLDSAP